MKNDEQLKSDVEQELRWEPSIHAEQIGVSVKSGLVPLDGHVDSYFEKWAAESAVMRVTNAKAVASGIKKQSRHKHWLRKPLERSAHTGSRRPLA
jgi:osmotically-inducible protein OsmY